MRSRLSFVLLILIFICNSCIYDEFRFKNTHLQDDWNMEVISPVFFGNWSLLDLLLEKEFEGTTSEFVTFYTTPDSTFNISNSSLKEPTTVIDSFNFYIDGEDYLQNAGFVFQVENRSAIDLGLQLRFYEKSNLINQGFTIQSGTFLSNQNISDTVLLSNEQIQIFKEADRVEFSTFFEIPDNGFPEPVNANSEIEFSIIFIGNLNREYD